MTMTAATLTEQDVEDILDEVFDKVGIDWRYEPPSPGIKKQALVEAIEEGLTISEFAHRTGWVSGTIRKYEEIYGVRLKRHSDSTEEMYRAMVGKGLTVKEAAEELHRSVTAVYAAERAYGLRFRREEKTDD